MARTKTATDFIPKAEVISKMAEIIPPEKITDGREIHQMIRSIGAVADRARGIWTLDQVDAHIANWLEQGYRVHTVDVTYLRPGPSAQGMLIDEPRWDVFYVLVKD